MSYLFKNKYRIITDYWLGFTVQIKRWWLPFWYQTDVCNTHSSLKEAEKYIARHRQYGSGKVVKEYEK